MCGIVGITRPELCPADVFGRMVGALAHRGPDDSGVHRDDLALLGHRRLSILDPSPAGHQPMSSPDGQVVVVFNGEIYNHLELRKKMEGVAWRSTCDTETLLHAYLRDGVGFVRHLVGMFAIAILDRRSRELILIRDRLGEKPLYWGRIAGRFAFASDLAAFLAHPEFDRDIDGAAVGRFLVYNYIPGPGTIFRNVRKLAPGTMLRHVIDSGASRMTAYWSARDCLAHGPAATMRNTGDYEEQLTALLGDSVRGQMLSDVPLGCFLSGGIDSSLIAATMARNSSKPVQTFTIGFREKEWDESRHARAVAGHIGSDHHEAMLSARDCRDLIPGLASVYTEPFADASALPTMLLARFARSRVTVALSGDGGDELFLGYDRYRWAGEVGRRLRHVPDAMRRAAAGMLRRSPVYRHRVVGHGLEYEGGADLYPSVFIGWNRRFVAPLLADRLPAWKKESLCGWAREAVRLLGDAVVPGMLQAQVGSYCDIRHYLVDDLLVKVDRAAMRVSLETRVPLLDHRIVEFALGLPPNLKWSGRRQKVILRRMLGRLLPPALFERPKAGFAVPLRSWFRGPLRPMLEESLSPSELSAHSFFNAHAVRRMMDLHFSGRANHERQLFALLMFQRWHREYIR